jgi:hypothetical protein
MKKLIVVITMLAISLPAVAEEVKLMCTLTSHDGEVTHDEIKFHDDEEYLSIYDSSNERCENPTHPGCRILEVDSTSVTWRYYDEGSSIVKSKTTLDRIDGRMKRWMGKELFQSGICVPFERAF